MVASSSGSSVDRRRIDLLDRGPGVGQPDHLLELLHARVGDVLLVRAADVDLLEIRTVVDVLAETLPALGVDDRELGARVLEAVLELGAGPPRVQRGHDRAGERRGPERDRPLGQVPHDDRDAVAFLHPVGDQARREPRNRPPVRVEGHPLLVVHHVSAVAEERAHGEDLGEGRRRVLPGLDAGAADLALLDFEQRARRRGHQAMRLGDRHRRKPWGQRRGIGRHGSHLGSLDVASVRLARVFPHGSRPAARHRERRSRRPGTGLARDVYLLCRPSSHLCNDLTGGRQARFRFLRF